jgi:hypothetical protein
MPELLLRNRPVESVFELIGHNENSLTFALGWCLKEAPDLLRTIAGALGADIPSPDRATVLLQEFGGKHGFTDIEVRDPGKAAWIFEAKIGFAPPSADQLQKYADRLKEHKDQAAAPLLVVIAQSDRRDLWLKQSVPNEISGIPLTVLSWGQVLRCCDEAYANASNHVKASLRQLKAFVQKVLHMQDIESNQVYVVSISNDTWDPVGTTFRAVVAEFSKYFHPVGPGWPKQPPNYIAFRWDGRLQSIHHIDDYVIVSNMQGHFPTAIDEEINPHFLYTLGPPIQPTRPVRTGDIFRAGRVWAALDLLLTCGTISEASQRTKLRQERA